MNHSTTAGSPASESDEGRPGVETVGELSPAVRERYGLSSEVDRDCWCGADGGEGCHCCSEDCPDDCMTDHKGEQ